MSGAPQPEPRLATELTGASLTAPALYRLMAWLSPSYPVGAFSYSGGLEWSVEAGDVHDAESLCAWLESLVQCGTGFCDSVFFVHAHRAVDRGDEAALIIVAELAAAFATSKERHLETTAQGRAFLDVSRAAWPCEASEQLVRLWGGPHTYPVAVAVAAAGHRIDLDCAIHAYLQGVVANLVSAGVRLVPLGQNAGQRVLADLEAAVSAVAVRAQLTPLADVGAATFRSDIAGMRHETQYTRLFRS